MKLFLPLIRQSKSDRAEDQTKGAKKKDREAFSELFFAARLRKRTSGKKRAASQIAIVYVYVAS